MQLIFILITQHIKHTIIFHACINNYFTSDEISYLKLDKLNLQRKILSKLSLLRYQKDNINL